MRLKSQQVHHLVRYTTYFLNNPVVIPNLLLGKFSMQFNANLQLHADCHGNCAYWCLLDQLGPFKMRNIQYTHSYSNFLSNFNACFHCLIKNTKNLAATVHYNEHLSTEILPQVILGNLYSRAKG
jgi:hypothetical protein